MPPASGTLWCQGVQFVIDTPASNRLVVNQFITPSNAVKNVMINKPAKMSPCHNPKNIPEKIMQVNDTIRAPSLSIFMISP
jgi:hypothetical protein